MVARDLGIKVKRIYESPEPDDGLRILVERLWPRGVRKDKASIDLWMKEIAPSHELRRWFSHDPAKWKEFKRRYWEEIKYKKEFEELVKLARERNITLLFSTKSLKYNNAVALKQFIEERLGSG
jgi:uncharacterized protein YeaO (DUF488 family)